MAYLIRRLDENTAPENFLRASFAHATRLTEAWERERACALSAVGSCGKKSRWSPGAHLRRVRPGSRARGNCPQRTGERLDGRNRESTAPRNWPARSPPGDPRRSRRCPNSKRCSAPPGPRSLVGKRSAWSGAPGRCAPPRPSSRSNASQPSRKCGATEKKPCRKPMRKSRRRSILRATMPRLTRCRKGCAPRRLAWSSSRRPGIFPMPSLAAACSRP